MQYKILDEQDSFAAHLQRMSPEDLALYQSFGNNKAETIFIDRVLYLYKCMGRGSDNKQRDPEVLAKIRVNNFYFNLENGFTVSLLNETTNEKQVVTGVPAKLFGFDVFACVPTSFTIKFNKILWDNGRSNFDASLILYIKAKNKADFFSYRNLYLETPPRMAALYPLQEWAPDRT